MQNSNSQSDKSVLRSSRVALTTEGQASPPFLGQLVTELLKKNFSPQPARKLSVLDIGCGLGSQMRLIVKNLPNFFDVIVGLDWSQATVEKHSKDNNSTYQEVLLSDSAALPFKDKQFDIALSMENLEHLYSDYSIAAIKEMTRVARFCVITTPIPQDCINFGWIYPELVEAINDPFPLNQRDFRCLESAVHKSTLFLSSMTKAGFSLESLSHGVYFGESSKIKTDLIRGVGIEPLLASNFRIQPQESFLDFKWSYVSLLAKSAGLYKDILNHPLYQADKFLFKPTDKRLIRKIFNQLPTPIKILVRAFRQFWRSLSFDYQN